MWYLEWLKRHDRAGSRLQTGGETNDRKPRKLKTKFKPQTEIKEVYKILNIKIKFYTIISYLRKFGKLILDG